MRKYECLPGYADLAKDAPYKPSDLADLADYDIRMTESHGGKPLVRNAEARKDYEMRAYALRVAAQAVFERRFTRAVPLDDLKEMAEAFEILAHEQPRGIKSTIVMTYAQQLKDLIAE